MFWNIALFHGMDMQSWTIQLESTCLIRGSWEIQIVKILREACYNTPLPSTDWMAHLWDFQTFRKGTHHTDGFCCKIRNWGGGRYGSHFPFRNPCVDWSETRCFFVNINRPLPRFPRALQPEISKWRMAGETPQKAKISDSWEWSNGFSLPGRSVGLFSICLSLTTFERKTTSPKFPVRTSSPNIG